MLTVSYTHLDVYKRQVTIAQLGQRAENVYFGKPSGLMDQMASSVGGAVAIDFAAVSYTHLPALSRPLPERHGPERPHEQLPGRLPGLEHRGQLSPGPVSYTHLDVYKRQSWSCAPGT